MTSYLKLATVQENTMYVRRFFEIKSVIKMRRHYRTQYGKDPPPDNAIRRWLKQFAAIKAVILRMLRTLGGKLSTAWIWRAC
jgi:hypothetical protein